MGLARTLPPSVAGLPRGTGALPLPVAVEAALGEAGKRAEREKDECRMQEQAV